MPDLWPRNARKISRWLLAASSFEPLFQGDPFPRAATPDDLANWEQKASDEHHSLQSTPLAWPRGVGLYYSPDPPSAQCPSLSLPITGGSPK